MYFEIKDIAVHYDQVKALKGISMHMEEGEIVTLIKPQFEAGRKQVGKGGIVRDPEIHRRVLEELLEWAKQCKFYLTNKFRK